MDENAQDIDAGHSDGASPRRPMALHPGPLYVASVLATVPFAISLAFPRPTVSQAFYFQWAALLGAFGYSMARLLGLAGAPPRDPLRPWMGLFVATLLASSLLQRYRWGEGIENPTAAASSAEALQGIALFGRRVLTPLTFPLAELAFYILAFACPWNPRGVCRLIAILAVPAFAASAYGCLQALGIEILPYQDLEREGKMKALSVFGHPNFAASYLGPALLLILGGQIAAGYSRPSRSRSVVAAIAASAFVAAGAVAASTYEQPGYAYLAAILAAGAAAGAFGLFLWFAVGVTGLFLMLAGARGIWMALLLATLAGGAGLAWRFGWRERRWARAALAGIVGMAVLGAVAVASPLGAYLKDRVTETHAIATRLFSFAVAAEMVKSRPLGGWGYGAFSSGDYFDQVVALQSSPGGSNFARVVEEVSGNPSGHVHNEFLEIAVERGLPGLFAFLGILAAAGIALARAIGQATDAKRVLLLLTLALALGSMLVDSLFSFPLHLPCSAALFWGLLGISARLSSEATVRASCGLTPRSDEEAGANEGQAA